MFSACGAINREMKWKEHRGARRPGRELKIKKKNTWNAISGSPHIPRELWLRSRVHEHAHIYTPISYREYSRVQKAHTNLDEDFRRG